MRPSVPFPGSDRGYISNFPADCDPPLGILVSKGGREMTIKGLALSMGIGAAAGAVAIMMMPKNDPTRKLAEKAATKVEDAANKLGQKLENKLDM